MNARRSHPFFLPSGAFPTSNARAEQAASVFSPTAGGEASGLPL